MDQQKHKTLIIFLISLLILVIGVVLVSVFRMNRKVVQETPVLKDASQDTEELITTVEYTEEELQEALDTPLPKGEEPIVPSQKDLQKALSKPLPKEDVTVYSQEELERALNK